MPKVNLPVPLPNWLYRPLRRMRDSLRNGNGHAQDLAGDRDVEFSFIAGALPGGPGEALDFGCGPGFLSFVAAQRGYQVLALDLQEQQFSWHDPAVKFHRGDVLTASLPENHFHVILNCSTVEHVGLTGRYGVSSEQVDGDLNAMSRLCALLRPGGYMLMTIPCGRDAVFAPLHRVYGQVRLPQLLRGFDLQAEKFWCKQGDNRWQPCSRETATSFSATADYDQPSRSLYALGAFVMRRPLVE